MTRFGVERFGVTRFGKAEATLDIVAPILQNRNPDVSEPDVNIASNVLFDLVDVGVVKSGIDAASVIIQMKIGAAAWDLVWTGEAQQPGYSVTRTLITDGHHYDINPTLLFPQDTIVQVRVQADDLYSNSLDTTYAFQTQSISVDTTYNWNFEQPGAEVGSAYAWDVIPDTNAEEIAAVESSILPYEQFESAWGDGNHISLVEFEDADLDGVKFNDSYGTIEAFNQGWRRPIRLVSSLLSNSGRSAPIYSNPNDAIDLEQEYRDLDTGGFGTANTKEGVNTIEWENVDWLFPTRVDADRFMQGAMVDANGQVILDDVGTPVQGHLIAELHQAVEHLATGDGYIKRFGHISINVPMHRKPYLIPSFCYITATIAGVEYVVTDDGLGNWVCEEDILQAVGNYVDYDLGIIDVSFVEAPDADTKIELHNEYGSSKTARLHDDDSQLPFVSSVARLDPASGYAYPIPPYNHTAINEFQTPNVFQGVFTGGSLAETFETEWSDNENSVNDWDLVTSEVGQYDEIPVELFEDFEKEWGWFARSAFTADHYEPPIAAGIIAYANPAKFDGGTLQVENFEGGTWDPIVI